jgi:translation initiation factor 3 subunit I
MFNKETLYVKQFRGQGFMTISKFNQDGNLLFIADKDSKYISLVSLINNQIIGTYNGHNGVVWHLDISKNSNNMISCSGDMSCIVWNVNNGDILTRISETGIPKYVSINDDLVIIVCDPISKRSKSYISFYSLSELISDKVNQLFKFTEVDIARATTANLINENIILVTYDNGTIKKINFKTNEIIQESKIHNDSIKSISFSKSNTFLTGSLDSSAKIINLEDFKELSVFKSKVPINTAIFTPDNNFVLLGGGIEAMMVAKTSDNDLTTKIFQVSNQKLIKQITNHFGPLRFIDFNKNNSCFVTASQDGTAKIHYFDKIISDFTDEFDLFGFAQSKETKELLLNDETIQLEDINETERVNKGNKKKHIQETFPVGHPEHKSNEKILDYTITTTKSNNKNYSLQTSAIRVTNLPDDIDIKELWDIFEYYGRIENNGIRIKKVYNDTFAFVNYLNEESAKKAIEKCDKKRIGYCIINVEMAKFK